MDPLYYLNGKYLPASEAKISVQDLGWIRGYGVFDYLRTYAKKPFHLDEHLLRLEYSLQEIGLSLPCLPHELRDIILTLLERNNFETSSIKIVVSGGHSLDHMTSAAPSTLCVMVYPFRPFPERHYEEGIRLMTTSLSRPFPKVKTTCYLPAILAFKEAESQGFHDALYCHPQGYILETTTSNFFAFVGNTLITPPAEEILMGITRSVILNIARPHFSIEERMISREDIVDFQEAFICSSSKEIMPVVHIDTTAMGNGSVGPLTQKLRILFKAYTQQPSWDPL